MPTRTARAGRRGDGRPAASVGRQVPLRSPRSVSVGTASPLPLRSGTGAGGTKHRQSAPGARADCSSPVRDGHSCLIGSLAIPASLVSAAIACAWLAGRSEGPQLKNVPLPARSVFSLTETVGCLPCRSSRARSWARSGLSPGSAGRLSTRRSQRGRRTSPPHDSSPCAMVGSPRRVEGRLRRSSTHNNRRRATFVSSCLRHLCGAPSRGKPVGSAERWCRGSKGERKAGMMHGTAALSPRA